MSLGRVKRAAVTSPNVRGVRNLFKMFRVNARPVPAKVIKLQAVDQLAASVHPGHPVSGHRQAAQPELSVPGGEPEGRPIPAARFKIRESL